MAATRRAALALCCSVALGCGGDASAPSSPSPAERLSLRLSTTRFQVFAGRATDAVVRDVTDALEAALPRVVADLSASGARSVTVRIWQDQAAFDLEVLRYFGLRLPTTGYVTGPDEIRVLAVPQVTRNATHELCHVVSLWVNPSLANNPRWLWESVALYENGELVDPGTLEYMARGRYPTLAELDADVAASRQVYEVGYLIGEFVVDRWGQAELVRLIQSNGDVARTLGLSVREFEEEWDAFVRQRYF